MIPIGPNDLEATGPKSERHALLRFMRQWVEDHRAEILAKVDADMTQLLLYGETTGQPMGLQSADPGVPAKYL